MVDLFERKIYQETPPPLGEVVLVLINEQDHLRGDQLINVIQQVIDHSNGKTSVTQEDVEVVEKAYKILQMWNNKGAPGESIEIFNPMGRGKKLEKVVGQILEHLRKMLEEQNQEKQPITAQAEVQEKSKPLSLKWQEGIELPPEVQSLRSESSALATEIHESNTTGDLNFFRNPSIVEADINNSLSGIHEYIDNYKQALANLDASVIDPEDNRNSKAELEARIAFLSEELQRGEKVRQWLREEWQRRVDQIPEKLYPETVAARNLLATTRQQLEADPNRDPVEFFLQAESAVTQAQQEVEELRGWYQEYINQFLQFEPRNRAELVAYLRTWADTHIPEIRTANDVLNEFAILDTNALLNVISKVRQVGNRQADLSAYTEELIGRLQEKQTKRNEKEQNAEAFQQSVLELDRLLKSILQRTDISISEQDDNVEREFRPVYNILESLKVNFTDSERAQELREKEVEVLKAEYRLRRRAYFNGMEAVEDNNVPMSEFGPAIDRVFKAKIFTPMGSLLNKLNLLDDPEAVPKTGRLSVDLEKVQTDFYARAGAHEAWVTHKGSIYTDGEKRTPPKNVTSSNFPVSGKKFQWFVREGLKDTSFDDVSNLELGETTMTKLSWDVAGQTEQVTFTETATGFCFRLFDDIYYGRELVYDVSGRQVTSRTIHTDDGSNAVFDYVTAKLKAKIREKGINKSLGRDFVKRKFKEHMMMTLNHSFLAQSSPEIMDEIYYAMHWPEYIFKEAVEGTATYEPFITALLFGFDPDFNFLEEQDAKKMKAVRAHFKAKKWIDYENDMDLYRETGITGFDQLVDAPAIILHNYAQGVDAEGNPSISLPFLEPPLRYFLLKPNQEQVFSQGKPVQDEFGEPVYRGTPKRFPVTPEQAREGLQGRYITLDDYQSIDGRRLYELMDLETAGSWVGYYEDLAKNGMNFLNNYLRVKKEDFLSKMNDPQFVAGFKKDTKYSMKLIPRLGQEIRAGNVMAEKKAKTMITMQLVYAKCLMEVDTSVSDHKRTPWTQVEVEEYLESLVRYNVFSNDIHISEKITNAIKDAVVVGGFWKMQRFRFAQKMQQQLIRRQEYH